MLAWFGGVEVDLRAAELAADARLSVYALRLLVLDGMAFFGGVEVGTFTGSADAS
jgi:hypothetical protein